MRHCLITGCTGFIGRHIVKALLEQGVTVRGLTRGSTDRQSMPDVELIRGDLSRPDTLTGLARGIDTVIHAAGHTHARESDEEIHWATTLEGTRHLLTDSKAHDVKRL